MQDEGHLEGTITLYLGHEACKESLLKSRCEYFVGAVVLKLRNRYELRYQCGS